MRAILFPLDPLRPRHVEPSYETEATTVARLGGSYHLMDHDAAVAGDAPAAFRGVPAGEGEIVYRGWMLRPERYRALHEALASRGWRAVTSPDAYARAHHLPGWCGHFSSTPESVWLPLAPGKAPDFARVHALLGRFGDSPVVLKDYVKSRKHEWQEACFIPHASDRDAVERIVARFLALTGTDLEGGLVFRRFVDLASIGVHPKSGMPLSREVRTFWLDGRPILLSPYWDVEDAEEPDLEPFAEAARSFACRFFTLDLAQRPDGRWIVVEAGDGQVSSLPERADVERFYRALLS